MHALDVGRMIDLFSVVQPPLIINAMKCAKDLSSHESTILLGMAGDRPGAT